MVHLLLAIFFATYGLVFIAEIVGDKLLYTTGVLAARFRIATVVTGVLLAFLAKMGVATFVFTRIAKQLPMPVVAAITGINFLVLAFVLWRRPDVRPAQQQKVKRLDHSTSQGVAASFAAVFFSEWGDKGMLACTAAALAANARTPVILQDKAMFAVWFGAVAAMMTKGALAATAGDLVRRWVQERVSPKMIRYGAVGICLLLGLLSVLEIVGYMPD